MMARVRKDFEAGCHVSGGRHVSGGSRPSYRVDGARALERYGRLAAEHGLPVGSRGGDGHRCFSCRCRQPPIGRPSTWSAWSRMYCG